jgi:hypothetical protein
MKRAMPIVQIATQEKIKELLQFIDRNRAAQKDSPYEDDASGFFDKAGLSYPSEEAPLVILCETDAETYYFQGGLFLRTSREGFHSLVRGGEPIGGDFPSRAPGKYRLKPQEAEFVLGILSVIDPMSCWTVIGNNLLEFVIRIRKSLDRWSVDLASLLLTQKILKKHAWRLHGRIFKILADDEWSSVPESASTDDGSIARFAGCLLGAYGSQDMMDRMIQAHWSISFQILKRITVVARHHARANKKAGWLRRQIEVLCRSFQKLGGQVASDEVWSYLEEIEPHENEMQRIVEILRTGFDGRTH